MKLFRFIPPDKYMDGNASWYLQLCSVVIRSAEPDVTWVYARECNEGTGRKNLGKKDQLIL